MSPQKTTVVPGPKSGRKVTVVTGIVFSGTVVNSMKVTNPVTLKTESPGRNVPRKLPPPQPSRQAGRREAPAEYVAWRVPYKIKSYLNSGNAGGLIRTVTLIVFTPLCRGFGPVFREFLDGETGLRLYGERSRAKSTASSSFLRF